MDSLKLGEMAKLIRSKNAGPFTLTIDIIFENKEAYQMVKKSRNFNAKMIADLYQLDEEEIRLYSLDLVNAIKISFDRQITSGDLGDTDVFGGQQHGPLVHLEIE